MEPWLSTQQEEALTSGQMVLTDVFLFLNRLNTRNTIWPDVKASACRRDYQGVIPRNSMVFPA